MSNYRVGQKVKVPGYKQLGRITKLQKNGEPEEVLIGNEVISVVGLLVQIVSLGRALWSIIKSIFSKNA